MKPTTRHSPRYIAIDILCRWEDSHLPIDQVVEQYIDDSALADLRDRQLIQSLVYGVLRRRGYIDWVIGKYSSHPLAKMKNRTLQALRIGLCQLCFMDRIPPSAAINETVQALKDMRQPKWLTGFVNGVLRSIERQRENVPAPSETDKLPDTAALNHPEWLIRRWQNRFGRTKTSKICRVNNTVAPLSLRVNTTLTTRDALLKKLNEAGIDAEFGACGPLALKLRGYSGPVAKIPGFADGLFQVQDEAAQLVSMLMGPLENKKSYLDGCAGLGGKTSHLAQMLPADSMLFAAEPNISRLKKLQENLTRLHLEGAVHILEGKIESLLPEMEEKFAGILIDAPCSGLGVIRRHPDIRWTRVPDDFMRYGKIQLEILASGARLLKPGGVLIYATCSTEPEENQQVVEKFLAAHNRFTLSDCRDVLPENGAGFVDGEGFFQTIPGRDDLDGFFAARMIKE